MDTISDLMTKNAWIFTIMLIFLAGLAFWFFSGKPKSDRTEGVPSNSDSQLAQAEKTESRIVKNKNGTLSLESFGILTGTVLSSRDLSFDEAVKLVGSISEVCTGRYNVGSAYLQCASVRRS